MTAAHPPNRLADEPSLYLRQHAHNPVDWYPWSREALERARRENRPILLSIGYSACHWCHVMERESFENEAIAKQMNDLFVSIKVDREERPDLDSIYMKAVQMMTGRGGWPMTVFLTPDLEPFYAGTYFPPVDRGRVPGFGRVLAGVAQAWEERGEQVRQSAADIKRRLEGLATAGGSVAALTDAQAQAAAEGLAAIMDPQHGGFGNAPEFAPKFPGSMCLAFLIGAGRGNVAPAREELVRTALDRMADGGIRDHLGGGFHRYSVDRYWLAPHFEKMLYDQALLADVYMEAALAFGEERYSGVAEGVLDYVARELGSAAGGFHAAQDADSEGVEGKYFVWTPAEVSEVVGERDAQMVCRFFDVTEDGNFEGKNILRNTLGRDAVAQLAALFARSEEDVARALTAARTALLARRAARVAPATDTKILADWNGLMIGAMARGGRLLGRADLVERAAAAADFVRGSLFDGDELLHFYAQGRARVPGFLDDHAFFGRGCLELYLATGRLQDFDAARRAADVLLARFEDREAGGFFFCDGSDPTVIVRERQLNDGAVPSGNAVAAELLLRLYELTGEERYREAGTRTLATFLEQALRNPHGGAQLLCAADRSRRGFATVVVTGQDAARARMLVAAALRAHVPEASVLSVGSGDDPGALPPAARGKRAAPAAAAAFVCRGSVCTPPSVTPEELRAALLAPAVSAGG